MSIFCIVLPTLVLTHARDRIKLTVVGVAAAALAAALVWARRRSLGLGRRGAPAVRRDLAVARMERARDDAHARADARSGASARRGVAGRSSARDHRARGHAARHALAALRVDAPLLAHRLLIALDDCALEAASLARDASAAELDRLTAQLGGLEADARTAATRSVKS